MNTSPTARESKHLAAVKELDCSVCNAAPPNEAHHIKQSCAYTAVALCADCHRGSQNGHHGRKAIWNVYKMDELDALGVTIKRLMK